MCEHQRVGAPMTCAAHPRCDNIFKIPSRPAVYEPEAAIALDRRSATRSAVKNRERGWHTLPIPNMKKRTRQRCRSLDDEKKNFCEDKVRVVENRRQDRACKSARQGQNGRRHDEKRHWDDEEVRCQCRKGHHVEIKNREGQRADPCSQRDRQQACRLSGCFVPFLLPFRPE